MAGGRSRSVSGATTVQWEIVITEWALASYLDLKCQQVFTRQEYVGTLRPDVILLRGGIPPTHPRFSSSSFWGPAKLGNVRIADGYKMKWRQVGQGKVQLRLP